MTTSPTTSAGPSLRVEAPPPEPQPRPKTADLVGIVMAGLPTLAFAAIMAGALALPFVGHFRPAPRLAEVAIFTVIPAIGLFMFARRWWSSIRALGEGAPSWSFLFVPFFIVVGVAVGVGTAMAIAQSGDPGMAIVRAACRPPDNADMVVSAEETARCEAVGRACMAELIAAGRATPAALEACVRR